MTGTPAESLGLEFLARTVFEGTQVTAVWDRVIERMSADPDDAGALMDHSMLLQLTGNREPGLRAQEAALLRQRCYRSVHGRGGGLRVLAFATPGDFMANTPLDFLLAGSDAELITCYIDGALPSPAELPAHDVAFLAIGQSDDNAPLLARLEHAFDGWPQPVINGRPERIAALSRDRVSAQFAGHPLVAAPQTLRVTADALAATAGRLGFPVIARPVASHAGHGLQRLGGPAELDAYLAGRTEPEFYVSPFLDYSGQDGLYRKLRITFAMGRPYIAHMAISERWMVHYLNADMAESAANRAEEAELMASFETGFAARHRRAFEAMCEAFQLDYFGIDCAETADGRLLLFEADVAMIVHDMDPVDLYPYKKPAMARLFAGFVSVLEQRARSDRRAA